MNKHKKQVLFFSLNVLISIVCFLFAALLGSYSYTIKIILGSSLYFTLVFFLCNKYRNSAKKILIIFLLPISIIFILINVIDFKQSWSSLPSHIFLILAVFAGFFYARNRKVAPILILLLLLLTWEFYAEKVFTNKMYFGSINQKVKDNLPTNNILVDSNSIAFKAEVSSKIIVLDFWNSGCGPCYKLFPFIDSIQKNIDTSKFDIRLVNIPLNGEKKEDNFRLLNRFSYNISQLFAINENVADSFKIFSYPTTVVIKDNKIIFRGEFENFVKLKASFLK